MLKADSKNSTPEIRAIVYPRDQHPISRTLIDTDALKIMYRLLRNGYKAFLVGGGVRDLLLGKKPKDFDIATDARPQKVRELFRNSRIIGRRFKLVHVFFRGGKIIEVSTFRDNRPTEEAPAAAYSADPNAERSHDNVYGNEISDALRRDLTINGLYYDLATFSIIDYVGGVRDLGDGVIRIIGDPLQRFTEDPVRMLRAIRHAARNGFKLEEKCETVLRTHSHLLKEASPVRIYDEFKKDISFGELLPTIRLLFGTGLLRVLLPGIKEKHLAHGTSMGAALERIDALQRNGRVVSSSTVITAMALGWAAAEQGTQVEECLRVYQEVKEITNAAFVPLSIPRRELELVHILLKAWKRCFSENRKSHMLPHGDLQREFRILLDVFACHIPDPSSKRSGHLKDQRKSEPRRSAAFKRDKIMEDVKS